MVDPNPKLHQEIQVYKNTTTLRSKNLINILDNADSFPFINKRGGPKVLSMHAWTLEEKKILHSENEAEAPVHNDNNSNLDAVYGF